MTKPPPWEPPFAGTEAEHLVGMLDRQRWTFRFKAGDLDDAGLRATIPSSRLTLGGLLKHLAAMEDHYASVHLHGGALSGPWDELGHDGSNDWEFRTAAHDSAETLYRLYDDAVARARTTWSAVLADGGLDAPAAIGGDDLEVTVRRVLCDLVEEYARHTGHSDLLREAVDGRTGEDPPEDWRP